MLKRRMSSVTRRQSSSGVRRSVVYVNSFTVQYAPRRAVPLPVHFRGAAALGAAAGGGIRSENKFQCAVT